jgi:hypothetical protein
MDEEADGNSTLSAPLVGNPGDQRGPKEAIIIILEENVRLVQRRAGSSY